MRKVMLVIVLIAGMGGSFLLARYLFYENREVPQEGSGAPYSCDASCCLSPEYGLTDAQRQQLHPLEADYCQCRDDLTRKIDQQRLSLTDLLLQADPDPQEIDSTLNKIAQLQIELEKKTVSHILRVKTVMKPDQREKFMSIIVQEMRKRCRHGQPAS